MTSEWSAKICDLKAGTTIVDKGMGLNPLQTWIRTSHPEDGEQIIRVIPDGSQQSGLRVEITKWSPDAVTDLTISHE